MHKIKFDDICINNKINHIESNDKNINDKVQDLYFRDKKTALETIAEQYDSSNSDFENNTDVTEILNKKKYRNTNEIILTSDESVDSESDSLCESESNSDDSTDNCNENKLISDDELGCENNNISKKNIIKKVFKQKNEYDNLPLIEDLKITVPEVLCDPLGEVAWTVEQMVIVRPKTGKPTLNLDTILFIEKGQRALGHIFDVFGQVSEPYYCVRFNSSKHIINCNIKTGMIVYYCPNTEYTSLVFLHELIKMKAVDEVIDDEPQFSDDEEEQAYLMKKKSDHNIIKDKSSEIPKKRRSNWQTIHPWNNNRQYEFNTHLQNIRPFYRSHHPWCQPRQQQNLWHQYNVTQNTHWVSQDTLYNQIQPFNEYIDRVQLQQIENQNMRPQIQWNTHYALPQLNNIRFPQTLMSPFTISPPPPPPSISNLNK